jgi:hypothetical protein
VRRGRHLQNVTTNSYDSLTEFHGPNVTLTTVLLVCSQVVACWRIPTMTSASLLALLPSAGCQNQSKSQTYFTVGSLSPSPLTQAAFVFAKSLLSNGCIFFLFRARCLATILFYISISLLYAFSSITLYNYPNFYLTQDVFEEIYSRRILNIWILCSPGVLDRNLHFVRKRTSDKIIILYTT